MNQSYDEPVSLPAFRERCRLSYTVLPAFAPGYSIHVRAEKNEGVLWVEPPENPALEQVLMDASLAVTPLSTKDLLRLSELLGQVRISPLAPRPTGCDGVTYRLTVSNGTQSMELEWWMEPPVDWSGVRALQEELEKSTLRKVRGRRR